MVKTYIDGWKIEGQFVCVESMHKWRNQTLCNGVVIVYSEYNDEDGWQPTCYVREPYRSAFMIWRSLRVCKSEDMPF